MKIRNGFVSNSSSSSFLIYGISVDTNKLLEAYNQKVKSGELEGEPVEDAYELEDRMHLTVVITPWDESYIGASWDSVKDDETGAQFKARVKAELLKVFATLPEGLGTHEEAWHDG